MLHPSIILSVALVGSRLASCSLLQSSPAVWLPVPHISSRCLCPASFLIPLACSPLLAWHSFSTSLSRSCLSPHLLVATVSFSISVSLPVPFLFSLSSIVSLTFCHCFLLYPPAPVSVQLFLVLCSLFSNSAAQPWFYSLPLFVLICVCFSFTSSTTPACSVLLYHSHSSLSYAAQHFCSPISSVLLGAAPCSHLVGPPSLCPVPCCCCCLSPSISVQLPVPINSFLIFLHPLLFLVISISLCSAPCPQFFIPTSLPHSLSGLFPRCLSLWLTPFCYFLFPPYPPSCCPSLFCLVSPCLSVCLPVTVL
ncbi:uncharacterized protein LOC113488899 [Athene cunicularia]|uniref:uncharacterized protein LOC113488899 n=1 Tax=Athene cunicularia TaxID=194338 RepID=UPI000EF6D9C7|nr:uncharacterized protein LOC113488899 [Athene cunicularia]